jgi:hypothetical protein
MAVADVYAEQALFGYRNGHDLVASSVDLDPDTLRLLRAATDVSVEGLKSDHLTTVLPLPKMKAHGFIRTWAAGSGLRPGSVWAHVVIVDFVALGRLRDFDSLRASFRRPADDSKGGLSAEYSSPIALRSRGQKKVNPIDVALAERIITATYGSNQREAVAEDRLERAEAVLFEMLEQQWPKLRRGFAFRTRVRPSETAWNVDVEVTPKGRNVLPPVPPWAQQLAADLERPNETLRSYLHRYGAESKRGREDMPVLVGVFEDLTEGDVRAAVRLVSSAFPEVSEMKGLKNEVFGPGASGSPWSIDEDEVLSALLDRPLAFDLNALEVGGRIATLAGIDEEAASRVLSQLAISNYDDETLGVIVGSFAKRASIEQVALVAQSNPELGTLVVGSRPDSLAEPAVWNALDHDLLTDVFFASGAGLQATALHALLERDQSGPLAAVCARAPSLWWQLLEMASHAKPAANSASATTLRSVLARIGTAAIGMPERPLVSREVLLALLVASDLSVGLWRRVAPDRWAAIWRDQDESDLSDQVCDRLAVVALVSGANAIDATVRTTAWRETFGYLHERLKQESFDAEAWALLASLLPAASDWDRCLRLRRGVVGEVRRDRWTSAEGMNLARESHGYEREMEAEIARATTPKRGLFDDLIQLLRGS